MKSEKIVKLLNLMFQYLTLLINQIEKEVEKMLLYQTLVFIATWKNIKSLYKNNRFKISAPTWNGKFELPDGSYSVSDIHNYCEYNLKKQ